MPARYPTRIEALFYPLMIMYLVHVINLLTSGWVMHLGIYPRDPYSLVYIVTAPFIHGSWQHLLNNTLGFVIFGSLCLMRGPRFFVRASVLIVLLGGFLVWVFARPAIHIGASGWVFGLWSLCIALAWYERSIFNIAVASVVLIFYGGMIYGVLPGHPSISFEAHLFGAISGVVAASILGRRYRRVR